MRRSFLALIAMTTFWGMIAAAAQEPGMALSGTWTGPWYRGMTSGVMTLEITADGSGRVYFTNLDNFGHAPAKLAKVSSQSDAIEFSANGAGGSDFVASAALVKNGKALRGAARYEGFSVKFELKRPQD